MRGCVLLLIALLFAVPAEGGSYDDFNAGVSCTNRDDWDSAIAFLTRSLTAGDLPAHLLPTAYIDRGNAYDAKGSRDLAIADFSKAITLAQDDVTPYLARGEAYEIEKKFDLAASDYGSAYRLRPVLFEALEGQGRALLEGSRFEDAVASLSALVKISPDDAGGNFLLGLGNLGLDRLEEAKAAFDNGAKAKPPSINSALWREIVQVRLGQKDSQLRRQTEPFDLSQWPGAVVRYYQDRITDADVMKAATLGEQDTIAVQRCEADIYVAEWKLLRAGSAGGRADLIRAQSDCAEQPLWMVVTSIELKRTAAPTAN